MRGIGGGHGIDDPDAAAAVAGVGGLLSTGFTPAGVDPIAAATGGAMAGKPSPQLTAAPTGIRPPQTEQRARIEMLVIFAGSRRKIERHSGQETFIENAESVVSGIRHGVAPE
jgi:hypothetical protein